MNSRGSWGCFHPIYNMKYMLIVSYLHLELVCLCVFELWATTQMHLYLTFLSVLSEKYLRSWSCWIARSPYSKIRTALRVCSIRCTGFFLWSEGPCMCVLHRHISLYFQGRLLGRLSQRKTQPLKRLKNIPPILEIWEVQGHTVRLQALRWQQSLSWQSCWCTGSRQKYRTHHRQNETLLRPKAVCPWFYLLHLCKCTPSQQSKALHQRIQELTRTLATLALPGQKGWQTTARGSLCSWWQLWNQWNNLSTGWTSTRQPWW